VSSTRDLEFRSSQFLLGMLELLALTGAAITQPLLDEFGRAPDFFIQLGARRWEVIIFAVGIALLPTIAIAIAELVVVAVAGERWRQLLHSAVLVVLAALFVVRALRTTVGWTGVGLLLAAVALSLAFGALHRAVGAIRQWLHFASILPVIALVTFLAIAPTSQLLDASGAHPPVHLLSTSRLSVVVVALDEFPVLSLLGRDGRIDPIRYPNFAALSRQTRWFRNTTSVGTHTYFANPAILTGRYPRNGYHAPTWISYPDTLFRLLGATYPTNAAESVTQLCAPSYCRPPPVTMVSATSRATPVRSRQRHDGLGGLFAKAGSEYRQLVALHTSQHVAEGVEGENVGTTRQAPATTVPPRPITPAQASHLPTPRITPKVVVDTVRALAPSNQPDRFTSWLARIGGATTPTLHYLHLLLPHYPWHLTASGLAYRLPPTDGDELLGNIRMRWNDDPHAAELGQRRHLMQVGYVDNLVGVLIRHLKSVGLWDRSIFVLTADHGVGFRAGGNLRELGKANRDDILGVPLFVHAPGIAPGIDDRPAETVDVVPTVAELLGARIPWPIDGRSLVGPPRPRSASHLVGIGHNFSDEVSLRRIDLHDHLARMLALAAWRDPVVVTGGRDRVILSSGPHGALIGRAVKALARSSASTGERIRLDLAERGAFEHVRVDQPVPIYITGNLDGGHIGETVVVALNGIIAGTAVVIDQQSPARRFGLLCDPLLLRPGRNRVAYFAVRADGSLTPLPFA
jgi:hypothetical protein